MARGQRTSLASLAAAVGDNSPVERLTAAPPGAAGQLPLIDLVANPRNPRDDLGDLDDLASIADLQLQPAAAVTRKAYLALYPDDAITARYVVGADGGRSAIRRALGVGFEGETYEIGRAHV